ncbi:hypothetical protein CANARDRAFT_122045 [[Candida] arabinofermentans NRRL YB-2248]|uniref:Uncharacterized protein n=1 Tax=[Candida] arabinofermentans NRRL YB-2248 TaxID=983967 RepID=A0A1E4T5K9_9ASCO|nr:hypothetical protein CANARDRAFT_122045 [[Candida] arabinofermentans NRRL YB-2248]
MSSSLQADIEKLTKSVSNFHLTSKKVDALEKLVQDLTADHSSYVKVLIENQIKSDMKNELRGITKLRIPKSDEDHPYVVYYKYWNHLKLFLNKYKLDGFVKLVEKREINVKLVQKDEEAVIDNFLDSAIIAFSNCFKLLK